MCTAPRGDTMAATMSTGHATPRRHRGLRKNLDAALTGLAALLAAALILALGAGKFSFQGNGSGAAAQQTRSLPAFTRVDLAGANNVIIRVGPKQSVVVHADRNLLERVTTRVRSGGLVIDTTPGNLQAKSPTYVTVSVPSLTAIELNGAGNIVVTGIETPSLSVALPGSGNVEASGSAAKLDVTLDGEGTATLRGLVARDATAELGGTGTIMLTATRSLAASLSGSGTIFYGGHPLHVTRRVTGTGTISAG
jgi:hypothetical protein